MRSSRFALTLVTLMVLGLGPGRRPAMAEGDMGRYVALGDSLTAGFAAGGLHQDSQLGGYARLLAQQVRGATVPFEQPLMTDPGIPAVLQLRASRIAKLSTLAPVAPRAGLGSPINLTLPRPYDNLSVPGAKAGDVLRTSTDGGGFHDLVLRGLGTQLEQALLLEPALVSLWVGLGDALGAAISGIVLDGVTLTPTERFSADFNAIVQSLVAGGVAAGVVATIPRPTDLPYVNTLATVAVDAATGAALEVDAAPVALIGPEGPLSARDFVLLTASPLLARGDGVAVALGGSGVPLPDQVVLSRSEALQINSRVEEYNRVIRRAAADVGFAVVEAAALFEDWRRNGVGIREGEGEGEGAERFSSRYLTGGLFSLDGVHPSPLGHALLANAFIEAINDTYEAEIALLGVSDLPARASDVYSPDGRSPRVIFTARASKNLRFGLGVPRPGRLVRLKQKALERSRERNQRLRRQRYELPAEPRMARGMREWCTPFWPCSVTPVQNQLGGDTQEGCPRGRFLLACRADEEHYRSRRPRA